MNSAATIKELVGYYEGKTESVLQRYGPGPRVHYHTGLIDHDEPLIGSPRMLRRRLVAAQERMTCHIATVWRETSVPNNEVLDVGCGLGGPAIFWAQEFGSNVTAVTIVPSHVKLVAAFAAQAGVGSKIHPMLCDALEVPGESRFDAVLAIESSCHLLREKWFRRVARLLRRGGRAFVADYVLEHLEYREPISQHWCARVGTAAEYLKAAHRAGLEEVSVEDVSNRTAPFWETTLALIQAEAREDGVSAAKLAKFDQSLALHALVRQGLAQGGLRYMLMSFVKE